MSGAEGVRYTRHGVVATCADCGRWSIIDSGCASAGTGLCWSCTRRWERDADERIAQAKRIEAEQAEAEAAR